MNDPKPTTIIHPYICHPTEAKIWAPEAAIITLEEQIWAPDAEDILPSIHEKLGFPTFVLSYLPPIYDREKKRATFYFLLLPQNGVPEGAAWQTAVSPTQSPQLAKAFSRLTQAPPNHSPWTQRDWWQTAVLWLRQQLAANGQTLTTLEPIKAWQLSTVLRATTAKNQTFYFKASPTLPLFTHEGRMMQTLATLLPGSAPPVHTVHPEQHWLIMPDLGRPLGSSSATTETYAAAHAQFAQVQIGSVAHADALLTAGCIDRRGPIFLQQIDALCDDQNMANWLDEETLVGLKTAVPQLKARYAKLRQFNLPETLVHGDLHLGNAFDYRGQPTFFDWTDACIAHPFFDLNYLQEMAEDDERAPAAKAAYLAQWTEFEPPERLEAAWQLAKPLTLLHHLITYQQMLGRLDEPLMQGVPAFLTQKIVNAM